MDGIITIGATSVTAYPSVIDKLSSASVTVSDTAANISTNLAALQREISHIGTINMDGIITIGATSVTAYTGVIDKLSSASVTVFDTAANISTNLTALQREISHIGTINMDGIITIGATSVTAFPGVIDKLLAASVIVSDTSANISTNIAALQTEISHIGTINMTGGPIAVSAAYTGVIDKLLAASVIVSDTATNISTNLAAIKTNIAHIGKIIPTSTTVTSMNGFIADNTIQPLISDALILDTGANISSNLTALQTEISHIGKITPTSTTIAQMTTLFANTIISPVISAAVISDTATSISTNITALQTSITKIISITMNDAITVSAAAVAAYPSVIDKLSSASVTVSDTADKILTNITALQTEISHIGKITPTNTTIAQMTTLFADTIISPVISAAVISDTSTNITITTNLTALRTSIAKIGSITQRVYLT